MSSSARDAHFPALHLRPPRNWLNDPNGLVFHDGHYHVFFQYNPGSAAHANMHWGHFRSPDLLHWELLPLALAPTPDGEDADGVWSGNAVSVDGALVAFHSAHRAGRWHQPVASAVSHDGGLTFSKDEKLLIPEPPDGTVMFRDPYVWRDGDQWRMLVGAGLADGRGAAVQYSSTDLRSWAHQGIFLARRPEPLPGGENTEEGWECAQYAHFPDGRGAVLVSAWDPEEGARCTAAWTGREGDGGFTAGSPQRVDHGPDFYAPALLPAPGGRWLMWGWSWEARDEERVGAPSAWADEVGWAGMLSLPREVTLDAAGRLRQRPAPEVDRLRDGHRWHATGAGEPGRPADLGEVGRSCDLSARLGPAGGLRLVTAADGSEYLDLVRDPVTGEVVVDRDHASLDPRAKGGSWRLPAGAGPVDLRIVLDRSVAEVFTADGHALTLRFYPVGDGPWRVRATATGTGEATCAVDAWDLAPLQIQDKRSAEVGAL
ncbi:glycoside hydrolase family 32 protein [Streptomyces sp. JJ36]|uniref:glycoside hydrolase family 32 protein n=1 Tax=Streptomyces sp. JJ36 TaxID=2736645 RepID=UPI001F2C482C|nr:glycoside hydrolase family 32 protein [Streptomyces sp. JJ36]MCF6525403.1 glycoside hydrolase family 32 protein [Streptomyces sp. JJ36]